MISLHSQLLVTLKHNTLSAILPICFLGLKSFCQILVFTFFIYICLIFIGLVLFLSLPLIFGVSKVHTDTRASACMLPACCLLHLHIHILCCLLHLHIHMHAACIYTYTYLLPHRHAQLIFLRSRSSNFLLLFIPKRALMCQYGVFLSGHFLGELSCA